MSWDPEWYGGWAGKGDSEVGVRLGGAWFRVLGREHGLWVGRELKQPAG